MQVENNKKDILEQSPVKKHFHRAISWAMGVIGLLLVLSIIGIGALLAGHVWNPSWNPFKPQSSDKVIREKLFQK